MHKLFTKFVKINKWSINVNLIDIFVIYHLYNLKKLETSRKFYTKLLFITMV